MAEASSILRNGERPGDQEPEVVWDVCGVGQLQVVGGHQLTQHLGGHRRGGGWDASLPPLKPWLWGGDSDYRTCASEGPKGTFEV